MYNYIFMKPVVTINPDELELYESLSAFWGTRAAHSGHFTNSMNSGSPGSGNRFASISAFARTRPSP